MEFSRATLSSLTDDGGPSGFAEEITASFESRKVTDLGRLIDCHGGRPLVAQVPQAVLCHNKPTALTWGNRPSNRSIDLQIVTIGGVMVPFDLEKYHCRTVEPRGWPFDLKPL